MRKDSKLHRLLFAGLLVSAAVVCLAGRPAVAGPSSAGAGSLPTTSLYGKPALAMPASQLGRWQAVEARQRATSRDAAWLKLVASARACQGQPACARESGGQPRTLRE